MYFYEDLELLVSEWGTRTGVLKESTSKDMVLKTISEVGELADNVLEGMDCKDDIGDVAICLMLLAEKQGTSLLECVKIAYEEIKNRQGVMVNGKFVKGVKVLPPR